MSAVSPKLNPINWWYQFPTPLRLITKSRFLASVGAGGVIYLTPLVFNQENFTATQIGSGLALAALIGTVARLASGLLLDRGITCLNLIRLTAFIAIVADFSLFFAQSYEGFIQGQLLIGLAAGLYWPSIELGVPMSCKNFPSSRGFALGRSADALGISIGATVGAIATWGGFIRGIYLFETICMLSLLLILHRKKIKDERKIDAIYQQSKKNETLDKNKIISKNYLWIYSLIPILLISLLTTGILSLLQSALPIDLVKGGINRPALSEGWSGGLIAIQLILLVILQWPTGRWISDKNIKYGLNISIVCLGIGCLFIGLSSLWSYGAILILLAQFPMAFGLAIFLPTSTEAIISQTPLIRQGLAMALFSQCFAISAFFAPIISGRILDSQGHGLYLWIGVFSLCLISLLYLNRLNYLDLKKVT